MGMREGHKQKKVFLLSSPRRNILSLIPRDIHNLEKVLSSDQAKDGQSTSGRDIN
jgi:hypothetical protein